MQHVAKLYIENKIFYLNIAFECHLALCLSEICCDFLQAAAPYLAISCSSWDKGVVWFKPKLLFAVE